MTFLTAHLSVLSWSAEVLYGKSPFGRSETVRMRRVGAAAAAGFNAADSASSSSEIFGIGVTAVPITSWH
jgi:hypothetical protein